MATVTKSGNVYTITAEKGESVRLDRPLKEAQLADTLIRFPSLYGYPITLPPDFVVPSIIVHEYGETVNENYWDSVEIPQV